MKKYCIKRVHPEHGPDVHGPHNPPLEVAKESTSRSCQKIRRMPAGSEPTASQESSTPREVNLRKKLRLAPCGMETRANRGRTSTGTDDATGGESITDDARPRQQQPPWAGWQGAGERNFFFFRPSRGELKGEREKYPGSG
jgi:hypothetical protein